MQPRSDTLFHFTKNIETLKSILLNGFWPRYCLEDFNWYNTQLGYIGYPMVCFCDIPLSRINDHVQFYGEYGIGLTKSWGLTNKLSPVIYIYPSSGPYDALYKLLGNNYSIKNGYYPTANTDINRILSFIKPIHGNMLIGGQPTEKVFYQENEWRYVPNSNNKFKQWITKEQFNDSSSTNQLNQEIKESGTIQISPNDIRYIFVKSDSDIPTIIDFIQSISGNYTVNDMKLLMSRVTSLESINHDL